MVKERSNGRLRVGLTITLSGVVASAFLYGVLAWASSVDSQVEVNTSDIKSIKTEIRIGFKNLEKVIKEGRK